MAISEGELLAGFPDPGGTFVMPEGLGDISELIALLSGDSGLSLGDARDIDRGELRLTGTARAPGPVGEVSVTVRFLTGGGCVTGVAASVTLGAGGVGVGELAGAWGLDLSDVPEILLADLQGLSVSYDWSRGAVFLAESEHVRMVFGRAVGSGGVALAGLKDVRVFVSDIPHVGGRVSVGGGTGVRGVGVAVTGSRLSVADAGVVNALVAESVGSGWWPALPREEALDAAGVWAVADCVLPGGDRVFAVPLVSGVSWLPVFPSPPEFDIEGVALRLRMRRVGLSWPTVGDVKVSFDVSVRLGWLDVDLVGAGFLFTLSNSAEMEFTLESLRIQLDGIETLEFTLPILGDVDLPGFPGACDLPSGLLTGKFTFTKDAVGIWPFAAKIFKISQPAWFTGLPDIVNPNLSRLWMHFDLNTGDFKLAGEFTLSGLVDMPFVLGGMPSSPEWNTDWAKVALLGFRLGEDFASLKNLPFIGKFLHEFVDNFVTNAFSLSWIVSKFPREEMMGRLNAWIGELGESWWPTLNWASSGGGFGLPDLSLDMDFDFSGVDFLTGIPWPPPCPPVLEPPLDWLDIPEIDLGELHVEKISLSWPGEGEVDWSPNNPCWVLRLSLDVRFGEEDVGIRLTGLGFDFDLKDMSVRPRFPLFSINVGGISFNFKVADPGEPTASSRLTARWVRESGIRSEDVGVPELLKALGVKPEEVESLPEQLRPSFDEMGLYYDFGSDWMVLTIITGALGWAVVVKPANTYPRGYLVGVRATAKFDMSDFWTAGEEQANANSLGIGQLQFMWVSDEAKKWTEINVDTLKDVFLEIDAPPSGGSEPARLPVLPVIKPPTTNLPGGWTFWAELYVQGREVAALWAPVARQTELGDESLFARLVPYDPLQASSIGPLGVSNFGVGYAFGHLYAAFDATLAFGPLVFQVLEAGVGIEGFWNFVPTWRGLAVELKTSSGLRIAGALSRLDYGEGFTRALAGSGVVEVPSLLSLALAGAWATNDDGWESLFAYAELQLDRTSTPGEIQIVKPKLPMLGPIVVTGVSLGFGVNSTLRLPQIHEIESFPFVKQLGKSGETLTPGEALKQLVGPHGWVSPAQGQYWIAGGLQFTVYSFINARALVMVEWGQAGWKAMLTGNVTLELPPTNVSNVLRGAFTDTTMGRVIIDFVIAFSSALSRLSMDVVIRAGSYLLDPESTLTGGVSLYVWGKNLDDKGISKGFVLTAGGYHPQFTPKSYFPRPQPIGWLWERKPFTIRAASYVALTDGAFMVGQRMAAAASLGNEGDAVNVQIWFTAHIDALVQWKPFYVDLAAGVSVGVSATVNVAFVRVRVSAEVGVDLHLWLPPIGGRARVSLWFVSFSFNFGSARVGAPPVPWGEFQTQVPAPRSVTERGQSLKPGAPSDESDARNEDVDPAPAELRIDGFVLAVDSALPASRIMVNGELFAGGDDERVDIRPMRLTGVISEQRVRILDSDGITPLDWVTPGWVSERRDDLPAALWGGPLAKSTDALKQDRALIKDCLTGVVIAVPAPDKPHAVGPLSSEALTVEPLVPDSRMPLRDGAVAGPPPVRDEGSREMIRDTIAGAASARSGVHRALADMGGMAPDSDGPLGGYAVLAGSTLTDPPLLTETAR